MAINEYSDLVEQMAKERPAPDSDPAPQAASPYADLIAGDSESDKQAVQQSMYIGTKSQPEQQAKVLRLAREAKLSAAIVKRNYDRVQQGVSASSVDYEKLVAETPALSEWLKNPDNAAVAHDDLDSMGFFDRYVTSAVVGWRKGNLESRIGELNAERLAETRSTGEFSQMHAAELNQLEKELEPYSAFDEKNRGFHPLYQTAAMLPNMTRAFVQGGAGDESLQAGPGLKRGLQGAEAGAVGGAVLGTISAGPVGGVLLAETGALSGFSMGSLAGVAEHSYQIEAGQAYKDYIAIQPDKSGNKVNPAVAAEMAHRVGIINAGLETFSDVVLFKLGKPLGKALGSAALKPVISAASHVPGGEKIIAAIASKPQAFAGMTLKKAIIQAGKMILTGEATEVGTEVLQEGVSELGGEATKLQSTGDFEMKSVGQMAENASAVAYPTAQSVLLFGGLSAGAHVYNHAQAMQQVEKSKEVMTAIGDASLAMKLKERDPETFRQYVETVTKNGPLSSVYIPTEAFETYFQKGPVTPEMAAGELGLTEEFAQAKEQGRDIKIPMGTWAEKVVGTPHQAGLANDVKIEGQEFSANEIKVREEEAEKSLEHVYKSADKEAEKSVITEKERADIAESMAAAIDSAFPPVSPLHDKTRKSQIDAASKIWAARSVVAAAEETKAGRPTTPAEWFNKNRPDFENHLGERVRPTEVGKAVEQIKPQPEIKEHAQAVVETVANALGVDLPVQPVETVAVSKSKPAQVFNPEILGRIRDEIAQGDHFKRYMKPNYHLPAGNEPEFVGTHSTYPKYFRNRGYTKAETLAAIDKQLAGKKLTLRQQQVVENLYIDSGYDTSRKRGEIHLQDQENPRGQIQINAENVIIRLNRAADVSTVLHESAHLFLDEYFDRIKTDGSEQNWEVLSEWLKVSPEQKKLTSEQHEQFARGFEAYIAEGKAPSLGLKNTFRALKRWMSEIYKIFQRGQDEQRSVGAALNVELSDPVRQVMARMVATESEIAEAEAASGAKHTPIEVAGLSPADNEKISKLQKEAHETALEILLTRQMQELKPERKEQLKKKRDELTDRFRSEIKQNSTYVEQDNLQVALTTKKTPTAIANDYINGKLTDVDEVLFDGYADRLGYSSGDELANKIVQTPTLSEAVSQAVVAEMAKDADLKDTPSIRDEALKAVHNEHRVELLALEMSILGELAEGKEISDEARARNRAETKIEVEAIKAKAKSILWGLTAKEASKTGPYFTAERKAAESMVRALTSEKYDKAKEYKRQQIMNHALATESMRIGKTVESWDRYLRGLRKKDPVSFKKEEHFNQAADLLARLGYTHRDYKPGSKNESLDAWSKRIAEQTDIVNIPGWVMNEDNVGPFNQMSVTEVRDVVNSLKNIMKVVSFENRTLTIMNGVDFDELKTRLKAETDASRAGRDSHVNPMIPTKKDEAVSFLRGYWMSLVRIQNLFRSLQGFKDTGAWTEVFKDPVDSGADVESRMTQEWVGGLDDALGLYSKKEQSELLNKRVFYPELGTSVPKMTLLILALNVGNIDNKEKLFQTRPVGVDPSMEWNESVVMGLLQRTLDAKDWQVVQKVWNTINSVWPSVSSLHKDLTGFSPLKVEALPFDVMTKDGLPVHIEGGYFPLRQDARSSSRVDIREQMDAPLYTEGNPGWKASTKTGHTKERTGAQYPIALGHSIIFRHLRDVTHDVAFRKAVIDMRRLVNDPEITAMIKERHGEEGYREVRDWVASVAVGKSDVKDSGKLTRLVSAMRKNSTVTILAFRLKNIVQNFANVMLYAGSADGFGWKETGMAMMTRGLPYVGSYFGEGGRELRDFVFSKSSFMNDKHKNPDYAFSEFQSSVFKERGLFREGAAEVVGDKPMQVLDTASDWNDATIEFGKSLMSGTDEATSLPVWVHAYNLAIDRNMSEREAVAYADLVIEKSIGSSRKYDAPGIQRGGEVGKILSMFMTFVNGELNRFYLEAGKARISTEGRQVALRMATNPRFLGFLASRLIAFNVLSLLLTGKTPGDDDDKIKWWTKQILFYYPSMLPGVRDVIDVTLDQALGLKSFGLRPSAAGSAVNQTIELARVLKSDKSEGADIAEQFSKTASYVIPYPDQFNSWFWNSYDIAFKGMRPKGIDLYTRRPKKER